MSPANGRGRRGSASEAEAFRRGRDLPRGVEKVPAVHIVMIEDDAGHARLIERNIRRAGVNNVIESFRDGTSALAALFGPDGTGEINAGRPLLILLDLNLPRKGGREVLAEIKADSDLRRIPVVVVTSSEAEQDIVATYDLHVNCYVTKPVDLEQFIKVVRSVSTFWLTIVKLPSERS